MTIILIIALVFLGVLGYIEQRLSFQRGVLKGFYDASQVREIIEMDPRYQDDLHPDHSSGLSGFTPLMRDRNVRLGPRFVMAVDEDGIIHTLFEPCRVLGTTVNSRIDTHPLTEVSVIGLHISREGSTLKIRAKE